MAGPGAAGLITQAAGAVFGVLSNFLLVGYQAVLIVFLVKVVGLNAGLAGLLLSPTLWLMLGGLALSTTILLLSPLPRLRDLPAHAPVPDELPATAH